MPASPLSSTWGGKINVIVTEDKAGRGGIQSGLTGVIQTKNNPGARKSQVLFFVLKVWARDLGDFCGANKAPKPQTKQTFSEFSFLVTEISEEMSLPTVV